MKNENWLSERNADVSANGLYVYVFLTWHQCCLYERIIFEQFFRFSNYF